MFQNCMISFLVALIFTKCNFEIEGEIQHIYKLSSPDKKINIYECSIESPMAFGSGSLETTVLKAGETYHPRIPGNFGSYVILGWVGNDTLKVIKFHGKEENSNISASQLNEIKRYKGFYLDIDHRISFGGGARFSFDSVYFTRDSVFFIESDSVGTFKQKLGLLKGQIRLSMDSDTVSTIHGEYFEKIEDHFLGAAKSREQGYPKMVGTSCEIIPNFRLSTSTFKNQSVSVIIKDLTGN